MKNVSDMKFYNFFYLTAYENLDCECFLKFLLEKNLIYFMAPL